jgi:hypothetical protein
LSLSKILFSKSLNFSKNVSVFLAVTKLILYSQTLLREPQTFFTYNHYKILVYSCIFGIISYGSRYKLLLDNENKNKHSLSFVIFRRIFQTEVFLRCQIDRRLRTSPEGRELKSDFHENVKKYFFIIKLSLTYIFHFCIMNILYITDITLHKFR